MKKRKYYKRKRRIPFIFKSLFFTLLLGIGNELIRPLFAENKTGGVRIVDGDTLVLNERRIRILGLDTPELKQSCYALSGQSWPCGEHAKQFLVTLTKNSPVECKLYNKDKYGRDLGTCFIEDKDIAQILIRSGYGIATGTTYMISEVAARKDKLGIWSGTFQTPKQWRDSKR